MKTLVLFCLALIVSNAWGFGLPSAMQFMSECKRLEGPESSEIMEARLDDTETPSQEAKCFYKCVLEKSEILRDGDFSPMFKLGIELALQQYSFNPQVAALMQGFKDCFVTTGVDACDLAYNYMKCMRPKMQRSMFL